MQFGRLALLSGFCLIACEAASPKTYTFFIRVLDEDSAPVSDARISANGELIGITDVNGILQAWLAGREGDSMSISARCPAGYRASSDSRDVILRSFDHLSADTTAGGPELDWQCIPTERLAALVVRTPGQPGLPVVIRGKEVTRTGPDGAAHALLRMAPGSSLRVALDTSNRPQLRPRNPVRAFQLEDEDAVFIFDQEFAVQHRPTHRNPAPQRTVPYKLE